MKHSQWAEVVGNGYNNTGTGHAVFFVLFLDGPGSGGRWVEGVNYIMIDTGVGDTTIPNGLVTPAFVDGEGGGKRRELTEVWILPPGSIPELDRSGKSAGPPAAKAIGKAQRAQPGK